MDILTRIVGTYYLGKGAQQTLKELPIDSYLNLKPEPDNIHDPNAVKVTVIMLENEEIMRDDKEIHLGYIPKDIAEEVLKKMAESPDYSLITNYKGKSAITIRSVNESEAIIFGTVF